MPIFKDKVGAPLVNIACNVWADEVFASNTQFSSIPAVNADSAAEESN